MNYSKNGHTIIRLALETGFKTAGEFAKFLKIIK